MNSTPHIVIAEPSIILQEGLSVVVRNAGLRSHIFTVHSLEEIQHLFRKQERNVVLMNISMIQNNNKGLLSLKTQFPNCKWVGFVHAFHDPKILSLFDAIITIFDPIETIVSILKRMVEESEFRDDSHASASLSEREIDVLKLLTSGNTNKEIAVKLNISINTVITHRKNISQKVGIKSISGLTIYALVRNLISTDYATD